MEKTELQDAYVKEYLDLLVQQKKLKDLLRKKQKEYQELFSKELDDLHKKYSEHDINTSAIEKAIRQLQAESKKQNRKKCKDCFCLLDTDNCSKSQLALSNSRCKECVKKRNKRR